MLNREVGFALNNGHRQPRLAGPKSASTGHGKATTGDFSKEDMIVIRNDSFRHL
jgi:hypothetical protein